MALELKDLAGRGRHRVLLSVAKLASGERVDVDTLSGLKASGVERPACFCLSCEALLVARLGERKQHHFAHKPEPGRPPCWASSPEGELHLSAKRVVEKLLLHACALGQSVFSRVPCPSCRAHGELLVVAALTPGHSVVIEHWGDPSRQTKPDVQVRDASGQPVLFVEVRVTHAITDEKVRLVLGRNIPLLELEGETICKRPPHKPILVSLRELNVPRDGCSYCKAREMDREEAAKAASAIETRRREVQQIRSRVRWIAEERVRNRWLLTGRTSLVAWCHVHVFCGADLVCATTLDVRMKWEVDTNELTLEQRSGKPLQTWRGSIQLLERIYDSELKGVACRFSHSLVEAAGRDCTLETFGGFRSSYEAEPPEHLRIFRRDSQRWLTMYPWGGLARYFGHRELRSLVRKRRWYTERHILGTYVEAKGVDEFFHEHRTRPDLAPRPPENDPDWKPAVEEEIDRILEMDSAELSILPAQ